MNLTNMPLTIPIQPEINCDGWWAQCVRCGNEVEPTDSTCPKCNQTQDWSWFGKHKKQN